MVSERFMVLGRYMVRISVRVSVRVIGVYG